MRFKSLIAAFAVMGLGLSACAPVNNAVDAATAKVSAAKGNVIMGIRAKAGAAAAQATVTISKIELVDAAGVVVVVTDSPQQVFLSDLKDTAQQILASASVPDGTYVEVRVTFDKADGTTVTKNIPVNITVASGKVTNIVVSADPKSVAAATSNGSSSVPDMDADDNSKGDKSVDGEMISEGTITAIADDKASFSFKMEHSTDVVNVKIVSGATNAADNTLIMDKSGATVEVSALAVGDEAYVEGELDATTNEITAKSITVEHEDSSKDSHQGDHDGKFALGADEALVKGVVESVSADAAGAVTSFTVTLKHTVGALPTDATMVTVNVDANTKVVMCGKDDAPKVSDVAKSLSPRGMPDTGSSNVPVVLTLAKDDNVFVRGTVVKNDAGEATNTLTATMVVVKPAQSATQPEVKVVESVTRGVVSQLNADTKTFTLTFATAAGDETVSVSFSDTTKMEGFDVNAPLADGQLVKVYGTVDQNGVVVAREIVFKAAAVPAPVV